MASLEKLVVQLQQRKQDATKLRKRAEKQLKDVRSAERRSTSGLHSIDKKIELEREDVTDVSGTLNQKNSQLESIERLVKSAEDRVILEKEEVEQVQQEIEFSSDSDEKQRSENRLRSLNGHIQELIIEIKSRQKTAKKIAMDVTQFSDIKSKISTKIQKQTKSKPSLRETVSTSHKAAEKFVKELEKQLKIEASTQKLLDRASTKFKELLSKQLAARKKATARKATARRSAKKKVVKRRLVRKTVAKRKPARKTAAKKKVAKRKPARKTAAKKKVATRKPARKTAAKKKVAKRKPSRKNRR